MYSHGQKSLPAETSGASSVIGEGTNVVVFTRRILLYLHVVLHIRIFLPHVIA